MGIIYKATNITNSKSYIGMTTKPLSVRKHEHETSRGSILLKRAINKYGKENITWEILQKFETDSFKFLGIVEKFHIEKYDSFNKGYNLTSGGDGCGSGTGHPSFGKPLSKEVRQKISAKNKGEKGNCGIKNGMYGRTGKLAPRYKKPKTKKEREKISKSLKGRTKENDPARKKAALSISKTLTGRNKKEYKYIEITAKKLSKGTYISPFGEFYSLADVFKDEKNTLGKSTLIRFYKNPNKKIGINSRYRQFRQKSPKELGFEFIGKNSHES